MKSGQFLKKILYSSVFLAGIPALLLIVLLHPLGAKYSVSVNNIAYFDGQIAYSDLNGDSLTEIVEAYQSIPFYSISAFDRKKRYFDQWNVSDHVDPHLSNVFFGNFDHDKFREVYIFTYKGDSLFLNVNEILDKGGFRLKRLFVTNISVLEGKVTSNIGKTGFYDDDKDGCDELYFTISSGFSKDPRRAYRINLVSKEVISSRYTGTIILDPSLEDADNDSVPEMFGQSTASGNFGSSVPYSDSSSWFMVFNDKLEFKFPPVAFSGFANALFVNSFFDGKHPRFLLTHLRNGADTSIMPSQLMTFSTDGKLIKRKIMRDIGLDRNVWTFISKRDSLHKSDRIFLVKDRIAELDTNLNIIRSVSLQIKTPLNVYYYDLENDGKKEFILYNENDEKLMIYDENLEKLIENKISLPGSTWTLSKYIGDDHIPLTYLTAGNAVYHLNLKRNQYSFLGYLESAGLYLVVLLFIILIKRINTLQIVQKESLNRRLVTLQLQGIKSQLDPHFTFNTLNSIASLIYIDDRQLAYDYMNKFTHLMRGLINDAERIYRSLSEEIEFVVTYLELEKLRFGDKFNYEIYIGEGVTQLEQVPKMVLQTFAENSIKHGIMSLNEGGMLKISANLDKSYLILSVEDNGIGRDRSAGQSTSTGKGLRLTKEFYDILNQLNKRPIHYYIIDLFNNSDEPCGTRVEIWVPVD